MNTEKTWMIVFQYVVGTMMVLGIFILTFLLVFTKALDDSIGKLLYLIIGSILTQSNTFVNYLFGSSKSSDAKTNMIYNSTATIPVTDSVTKTATETISAPPVDEKKENE